jgi:hypothetical protein
VKEGFLIMEERRRSARKYLSFFSRVIDPHTDRLLGYLVDLTTRGALMIGNISFKTGAILPMRIDLPEEFSPLEHLDLVAKVVWILPDVDPELYRTGLQMVKIEPSNLDVLQRLLTHYVSKNSK